MRRMLIVEDEELVGVFLSQEFSDIGFKVDLCGEAEAAFALCCEHQYDAAILDIVLPDFRGDELALMCRKVWPNLPIVLASGLSSTDLAASFPNDPLIGFLSKPYEMSLLLDRLKGIGVNAD